MAEEVGAQEAGSCPAPLPFPQQMLWRPLGTEELAESPIWRQRPGTADKYSWMLSA